MWLKALAAAVSVAVALTVLVLTGRAGSARPAIGGGRILVTLFTEPCCRLAVIDRSGVHAISLGAHDPSIDQSAWAGPDAVVFTSLRAQDGRRHIYEVPVSGGRPRRLAVGTPSLSQQWPAVSPDGTEIAYTETDATTGADHGIQVNRIDGGVTRRVAPPVRSGGGGGWGEPQFAPGSDRVLVASRIFDRRAGRASLRLLPGPPRNLTAPVVDAGYPRISPDGRSILFSQWFHRAQVGGPAAGPLWSIPVAGGSIATPLTTHPAGSWSYEGDWSPDGRSIVYLYRQVGWDHNQLRVMNADGSDDHALWTAPSGTYAAGPDWGS